MIGWCGASRYYGDRYWEGCALECRAMKQVREIMRLTLNLDSHLKTLLEIAEAEQTQP